MIKPSVYDYRLLPMNGDCAVKITVLDCVDWTKKGSKRMAFRKIHLPFKKGDLVSLICQEPCDDDFTVHYIGKFESCSDNGAYTVAFFV